MKIEELFSEWFSLHSLQVSAATAFNYQKGIAFILKRPEFSGKNIEDIDQCDIQNFFIFLNEKGCSQNTILNFSKPLSMAFKYAEKKGKIKKTPYYDIIIPKKTGKEMNPFLPEEVEKILEAPMTPWLHDTIIIAFKTGMRKSEIFALRKTDVNFESGFLTVRKNQSFTKDGVILSTPKTKASIRRIDLDLQTLSILKRHKMSSTSEFLFCKPNGEMFVPWNISNQLEKKCVLAGVVPRSFHNLRHGHATWLLSNNVHPKIVQARLGHSSIKITLDTYSHVIPGMQKIAVSVINQTDF